MPHRETAFRDERIVADRIDHLPRAGVDAEVCVRHNPSLENCNLLVPGIIGFLMVQISMNLSAFSIVRGASEED